MSYSRIHDPLSGRPNETLIRRDSDGAFVPADTANGDWQAYQAWLEAGNAPADAVAPAPHVARATTKADANTP